MLSQDLKVDFGFLIESVMLKVETFLVLYSQPQSVYYVIRCCVSVKVIPALV